MKDRKTNKNKSKDGMRNFNGVGFLLDIQQNPRDGQTQKGKCNGETNNIFTFHDDWLSMKV